MLVRSIRSRTAGSKSASGGQRHQAGRVDDYVDAAESLLRLVEQAGDGLLVGDVSGDGGRLCPGGLGFGHRGVHLGMVRPEPDDHRKAVAGQLPDHAAADPARSAR
jgi:hypothetical protein